MLQRSENSMTKPSIFLLLLCLPLLFILGAKPVRQTEAKELVAAFVEALNYGDAAHLKAFAEKWCTNRVSPDERATRLKGISQDGAPFKFMRMEKSGANQIIVILEDKRSEQVGLKIDLSPEGKY